MMERSDEALFEAITRCSWLTASLETVPLGQSAFCSCEILSRNFPVQDVSIRDTSLVKQ